MFLQHFTGFIFLRTFVVYHVWGCYQLKRIARNCQQIWMKVLGSESVLGILIYKVRTNGDITKSYNKSLINLVCSVCTGMYCLIRFLSHKPRSFVTWFVRKPSDKNFPCGLCTRLINKSLILHISYFPCLVNIPYYI